MRLFSLPDGGFSERLLNIKNIITMFIKYRKSHQYAYLVLRRPNRYLSSMIIKYFDYYDYRKLYGHHHEVVLPSRNIHFSSGNVYYLQ